MPRWLGLGLILGLWLSGAVGAENKAPAGPPRPSVPPIAERVEGRAHRAEAATGKLRITPAVQEITLTSGHSTGHKRHSLRRVNQPVELPAGEYRLQSVRYTYTEGGQNWSLQGQGDAQSSPLVIAEGETTHLELGPPLQARITASGRSRPGQNVSLRIQLVGANGELYSPGGLTQNGRRPPEPTFRIVDATGETVAKGAFKYG